MKFSIIHPSRGRPQLALQTAQKWVQNLGSGHEYEYVLSIDNDDPDRDLYIKSFQRSTIIKNFVLVCHDNQNVVQAMNKGAAAAHEGDVLVCISDDMDCPLEWGSAISHSLDIELPEALQVDVIHPDIPETNDILCLPILTRKLYKILNYVYYPEYSGIFADDDLASLCLSQGWLRKNFKLKFRHIHWSNTKGVTPDTTHRRHDNEKGWTLGRKVKDARKLRNYDLPEPEKILSILIPTVDGREAQVTRLTHEIVEQLKKDGYLAIVDLQLHQDNKEMSIGTKRDIMYKSAIGKYSWQIDDDDRINLSVFRMVIPELLKKPEYDCVGFMEECTFDNRKKKIACHSIRFPDWAEDLYPWDYVRSPYYKDIIRTSIAQEVGVKDMRYGEDHDFAKRLRASELLKLELFIDEIIYYYLCSTREPHNLKYGIK